MGEKILSMFQKKEKEYRLAFLLTFAIALLIHLYKFTNTLPNHDSLYNYYSDQNVLGSGRWALSLACGFSSYFDLPWVIGLFSCVFLALTVVVIVALFKIKNPVVICLTGAILAASPATTETFFFMFTADGYMISMFLAALAVYLSRMEEKRLPAFLLSGLCICVSCGIYQAYVSFSLILAVSYFIYELFRNQYEKKLFFKWILRQIIIFSVSLAVYYIVWKLFMLVSGTTANSYQGISEVGKISAELLVNGLTESIKTVLLYFLQWDVFDHGLTPYNVLNIIFLTVMAAGLIIACIKSGIIHRKWAFILLILCLVAIIPFTCVWHFVSESVTYRAMMLQSISVLFILTVLLYEKWAGRFCKEAVCLLLVAIVFNNALMANICYFHLNQCYERTYADGLEMMIEIHDLQDEYEFDKIAVVGNRILEVQYDDADPESGEKTITGNTHILNGVLEENLLYDAEHTVRFLRATFGLDLTAVSQAELEKLALTEKVKSMECWPSGDSMAVIDGTLIIKLANEKVDETSTK